MIWIGFLYLFLADIRKSLKDIISNLQSVRQKLMVNPLYLKIFPDYFLQCAPILFLHKINLTSFRFAFPGLMQDYSVTMSRGFAFKCHFKMKWLVLFFSLVADALKIENVIFEEYAMYGATGTGQLSSFKPAQVSIF